MHLHTSIYGCLDWGLAGCFVYGLVFWRSLPTVSGSLVEAVVLCPTYVIILSWFVTHVSVALNLWVFINLKMICCYSWWLFLLRGGGPLVCVWAPLRVGHLFEYPHRASIHVYFGHILTTWELLVLMYVAVGFWSTSGYAGNECWSRPGPIWPLF